MRKLNLSGKVVLNRDRISGTALLLIGILASSYSFYSYNMGTISRMGPGYMPVILGVVIGICGAITLFGSIRYPRHEEVPFDSKPFFSILAGLAGFAWVVGYLGIVPAIFVLIFLSTLHDKKVNYRSVIVMAFSLSIICYIIFIYLIGSPIQAFHWRF